MSRERTPPEGHGNVVHGAGAYHVTTEFAYNVSKPAWRFDYVAGSYSAFTNGLCLSSRLLA